MVFVPVFLGDAAVIFQPLLLRRQTRVVKLIMLLVPHTLEQRLLNIHSHL